MIDATIDNRGEEPTFAAPAGDGDYVVQPGDCLSSIAYEHGFFWETLWKLPENASLREVRGDPNVLLPADRVTVPEIEPKSVARPTGATHVFRRRGVPEKLRIKLTEESAGDRKGIDYRLYIDGVPRPREGVTDDEGMVAEWIPPNAKSGRLVLRTGEEMLLAFGSLDPVDSVAGAVARLMNLRLMTAGDDLREVLLSFQTTYDLAVSGELDAATREKLVELYGC